MTHRPGTRPRLRRLETGMVTAEAALVIPVLVCVTAALAWLVALGVVQVRCVDAAREAARLSARGEPASVVAAAVAATAADNTDWSVRNQRGLVVATVESVLQPRLPLVGQLPAVTLSAGAAAARESS